MRIITFLLIVSIGLGLTSCKGKEQSASTLQKDERGWTTDYDGGIKEAKAMNKQALVLFTGSDWCRPCMMLEGKVFQSDEFLQLSKDFVLVKLDFPRRKPMDPEIKKRNRSLANNFGVRGYPTVVALNSEGKEITRWVGFRPTDKEKYLSNLKALLK